jgi:hypothetical protein
MLAQQPLPEGTARLHQLEGEQILLRQASEGYLRILAEMAAGSRHYRHEGGSRARHASLLSPGDRARFHVPLPASARIPARSGRLGDVSMKIGPDAPGPGPGKAGQGSGDGNVMDSSNIASDRLPTLATEDHARGGGSDVRKWLVRRDHRLGMVASGGGVRRHACRCGVGRRPDVPAPPARSPVPGMRRM